MTTLITAEKKTSQNLHVAFKQFHIHVNFFVLQPLTSGQGTNDSEELWYLEDWKYICKGFPINLHLQS